VRKVVADQSASLDGFSAGINVREGNGMGDNGDLLHAWIAEHGFDRFFDEQFANVGTAIVGRTMFDVGVEPWGDNPPYHMPVFVVTHRARQPLVKEGGTTYFFVTEGIENALQQARSAADNKDVLILGGADIIQQFMNAGLVDELRLHLAHVLLGDGTHFWNPSNAGAVELDRIRLIESPGATHFTFNVKRKGLHRQQ
jgi:dihydrofolate reductase